ncbi:MAG: aminomethyl-transferring glycine dehydrogenase [Alphaproteobacteria bacterium]|nr:aminomethyl-transferring glycine dehydrogenase [Alphaproteobacteria bacterium]
MTSFVKRHIGISAAEEQDMLTTLGLKSLNALIDFALPQSILENATWNFPEPLSEAAALDAIKKIAEKNSLATNFIGQGYYGTLTPSVILRNIFENPGWYTQYTPYQAEISQGRLTSLLNFQTMVIGLTGLPIANASLLDEATAIAEGMILAVNYFEQNATPRKKVLVDSTLFEQSISVVKTRAKALEIHVLVEDLHESLLEPDLAAVIIQYPNKYGYCNDWSSFIKVAKEKGILVIMACDILSLVLLKSPQELGADIACGSTQRLGVPIGFGGPHAAYFAVTEPFKRMLPGRIIGVSIDAQGNPALRMALQTREQHIRRDKATSNICTAQALLANMAAMYAVYHGPDGLLKIAEDIHFKAGWVLKLLQRLKIDSFYKDNFFDTITFNCRDKDDLERLQTICLKHQLNVMFHNSKTVSISVDEATTMSDLYKLAEVLSAWRIPSFKVTQEIESKIYISSHLLGSNTISIHQKLKASVFNSYRSETKLLRFMKQLENKDLSLVHAMISLGSCTMKLNATTEMIPLSWDAFSKIHPNAPKVQTMGYQNIIEELEYFLCKITGFDACSLQPNSGAQGEYAGLLTMKNYMQSIQQSFRNIILIPMSAHGTNPASAIMAGLKVVPVQCLNNGHIDLDDLKLQLDTHSNSLLGCMITYPSTYGVFDEEIKEICDLVHKHKGLVYLDGANMNAQVGLTSPAFIGADLCHLNLHKTFAIPHGGGGPGMGPICVRKILAPFLPQHCFFGNDTNAVSAAPYSSASILIISYLYITMLGQHGLTQCSKIAILNANYMRQKLSAKYFILYTNSKGYCAHEFIVDLRPFKKTAGIEAEDVAKRLMDYGFHAPTLSFPVPGTLMIEPTESEDKAELDRFCEALLSIHDEIKQIENGVWDKHNNPLKNAPHTQTVATANDWNYPYSRETAVFPLPSTRHSKFWPSVGRLNQAQGDRNLICSCEGMEQFV